MTVKELIAVLNTLPDNVIVTYTNDHYTIDKIIYDNFNNTITFTGSEEFDTPSTCDGDCMECHEPCQMNQDIPDDVDESNYDPYCGCDIYEIDEMW